MPKQTKHTNEAVSTPAPTPAPVPATAVMVTDKQLITARNQVQRTAGPLSEQAEALVVKDAAGYLAADRFLSLIRTEKKAIIERLSPLLGLIEPLRAGLDKLYELRRTIDKPFDDAAAIVKQKMAEQKREEARLIFEEREKRRRAEEEAQREAQRRLDEEVRLRRQAEEAERRAERARTEEARRKAEEQAREANKALRVAERATARAEDKAELVASKPVMQAVKAEGSGARTTRRWRVVSVMDLAKAVIAGDVPETVLTVDAAVVREYWEADRAMVEGWPGVEGYDDVVITERRGGGR